MRSGVVMPGSGKARIVEPKLPLGLRLSLDQPPIATHTQAGLRAAMIEIAKLQAEVASLKQVIDDLNALRRERK